MPPVSRKDSRTARSVTPTGRTAVARPRTSATTGRASITACVPVLDASPSESTAGIAACENGPRRRTRLLIAGALRAEVGEDRRRLVGERAEPDHRRLELVEEPRQRLDVVLERVALLGRRLGHLAGVADRARDPLAIARQRRQDRVGVDRELGELRVLLGQDREHLVGLLQRRIARRMTSLRSLPRPARPVPSSLRISDSRSRSGCAHRVADQVDVDRLHRVGDRQQPLALARAAVDLAAAPAAARSSTSAAASACTRRSARRSGSAGARCSSRRGGSPGSRAR